MKHYTTRVCRGSWELGNNCGICERCMDLRPGKLKEDMASLLNKDNTPETPAVIAVPVDTLKSLIREADRVVEEQEHEREYGPGFFSLISSLKKLLRT